MNIPITIKLDGTDLVAEPSQVEVEPGEHVINVAPKPGSPLTARVGTGEWFDLASIQPIPVSVEAGQTVSVQIGTNFGQGASVAVDIVGGVQGQPPAKRMGLLGLSIPYGSASTAKDWELIRQCQTIRHTVTDQPSWGDRSKLTPSGRAEVEKLRAANPPSFIISSLLNGWWLDLSLLADQSEGYFRRYAQITIESIGDLVDAWEGTNEGDLAEFNRTPLTRLAEVWAWIADELKKTGKPVSTPAFMRLSNARYFLDRCKCTAISVHSYEECPTSAQASKWCGDLIVAAGNLPIYVTEAQHNVREPSVDDQAKGMGQFIDAVRPNVDALMIYAGRIDKENKERDAGHMALYTRTGTPRQPMIDAWKARLAKPVYPFASTVAVTRA